MCVESVRSARSALTGTVSGRRPVMAVTTFSVEFAPDLHLFLPLRVTGGVAEVVPDGVSTLGHVVESLGVPLTEVGRLRVDGWPVAPSHRPTAGERVQVDSVERPQRLAPGSE